jgi:hypothetical protein
MSLNFIVDRFPVSDPNTDLNFDNDILYSKIVGDVSMINPAPYDNADQTPKRKRDISSSDIDLSNREPSYNIFLFFIMIIILIILVYYLIESSSHHEKGRTESRYDISDNPYLVYMGF